MSPHNATEALSRMEYGSNPGLALFLLDVVAACAWLACTKRGR